MCQIKDGELVCSEKSENGNKVETNTGEHGCMLLHRCMWQQAGTWVTLWQVRRSSAVYSSHTWRCPVFNSNSAVFTRKWNEFIQFNWCHEPYIKGIYIQETPSAPISLKYVNESCHHGWIPLNFGLGHGLTEITEVVRLLSATRPWPFLCHLLDLISFE